MGSPATAHFGPWTERDLLALPDDGQRHELVEGRLLVSPPPAAGHQSVAARLCSLLLDACPAHLDTMEGVGVRIPADDATVLVPDILVVEVKAVMANRSGVLAPGSVHLVVEIVSPRSVTTDRLTKPALYARAEIPSFWCVEQGKDGPSISTFRLLGGGYAAGPAAGPHESLVMDTPFPVRIDIDQLGPGRRLRGSR